MTPDITELSLVFLGSFNPSIFNPDWLVHKGLITEEESQDRDVEIINPHLSKFKVLWADFEISNNKAQIRTTDGTAFESLRDMSIGIFNILNETPLNALGINHIYHYQINTKEEYIEVGNILAPFKNWEEILSNPKMLRLEMVQEERNDDYKGSKRIRVTPSNIIEPFAIRIDINNHFELNDLEEMNEKLKVLSDNWDNSSQYVEMVMEKILRETALWK